MAYPIISADSHVTEPPNTYSDYIDKAFLSRAPRMEEVGDVGDVFVVDGMARPVLVGLAAAAGKPPEEIRIKGTKFAELHRGGWDPEARIGRPEARRRRRRGHLPDGRHGALQPLATSTTRRPASTPTTAGSRELLLGPPRPAARRSARPRCARPRRASRTCEAIKALGLRGVMMPGNPAVEDYDSTVYDEFWEAAVELELPLSFHILTVRETSPTRGPKMNSFLSIIRGCQDIMGTLILGGVFERHPKLKVVCVEADAGWVPHYMYRMDHAYKRHRYWLPPGQQLSKLPSEYFREHIYTTFQDDWVAFKTRRPDELAAADVGERLPAQRLDLAVVAGHADGARRGAQRRAAPRDPVRATSRSSTRSTSRRCSSA